MTTMADIQNLIAKADARLSGLRDEIAKIEDERREYETTLRVLARLSGEKPPPYRPVALDSPGLQRPAKEKKALIYSVLGVGEAAAMAPVDVAKALAGKGVTDIPIEIIRTTLWRGANKYEELRSDNGSYWIHEAESPLFGEPSASISSTGLTTGETQPSDHPTDREASHNALFSQSGEVVHEVE